MTELAWQLLEARAVLDTSGVRIFPATGPDTRGAWRACPPLRAQVLLAGGETAWAEGGYSRVEGTGGNARATGELALPGGGLLRFTDEWGVRDGALILERTVAVRSAGSGARGFFSAFEIGTADRFESLEPFLPGYLYGDRGFLPSGAFGGETLREAGVTCHMIREDGIPQPLAAARRSDGTFLALLHRAPDGATTLAETTDMIGHTLVGEAFQFASLGYREDGGETRLALWFPGTEGAAARVAFDWGKRHFRPRLWRGRYHPLADGFSQRYSCAIAAGGASSFPEFAGRVLRVAMRCFDPPVVEHDLLQVESTVIAHLSGMVEERPGGVAGIPFLVDAVSGDVDDGMFALGFCGRNESAAHHLIRIGHRDGNERYLAQGRKILDFWTSRTGPGFTPVAYWPEEGRFGGQKWSIHARANVPAPPEGEAASLRELAEGHRGCLRAWQIEAAHGIARPAWLEWCRSFGEWLLGQQGADGAFPRWWRLNGEVLDPSPTGVFNAIPFLVELAAATGDGRFREAAVKAGRFLWAEPRTRGIFQGGTIDNPDVIDKEAASLSLEAFLALHEATGDAAWLEAARVAADMAASWIYLWNVPMPRDADPDALDWKPGASTVGMQAVAVGGGGADQYLSFNPGEFQRLGGLVGDDYYRRIARLLLHNTKSMLALPGRTFGLRGPGWQQEHWSFALHRGCGAHRAWLPWVTVCHLVGMERFRESSA